MESENEYKLNILEKKVKSGYNKYTIKFKLKVIELIHLNISLHCISNRLGIDRKTLIDWLKSETNLLAVKNKNKKFRCNKTKGIITNLSKEEEKIMSWIIEKRENKKAISTKSLLAYACTLNRNLSLKNFNTQLKWVYRFIKRNVLSIRRISHIGQTLSESKETIFNKFKNEIIKKRKQMSILYDEDYRVVNMDETSIFLEMAFNTTIDFKGNKNIEIDSYGREQYRITVILAIAGDGTKLSPMIILKGEPVQLLKKI